MKTHPICLLAPPLLKQEIEALRLNLQTNGLIDPIITYKGEILDGRHRYEICKQLKIDPKFKEFSVNGVGSELDFVVARLQGRNMTQSQKACIAVEFDHLVNTEEKNARKSKAATAWHRSVREGTPYVAPHKTRADICKMFAASLTLFNYAEVLYNENMAYFLKAKNGGNVDALYKAHRQKKPAQYRGGMAQIQKENIEQSKSELKIPHPWDGMHILDKFLKDMSDHGWVFELRVHGRKFYSNFSGNGSPAMRDNIMSISPANFLGESIVQAAFERIGGNK